MKTYEILIDDIGTENYIDADNEQEALSAAKEMVGLGLTHNYVGSTKGIITVDEQSASQLSENIRRTRDYHLKIAKEKDDYISGLLSDIGMLESAVRNRDADKKNLKEQLAQAQRCWNERQSAVMHRDEIINDLKNEIYYLKALPIEANREIERLTRKIEKIEKAINE